MILFWWFMHEFWIFGSCNCGSRIVKQHNPSHSYIWSWKCDLCCYEKLLVARVNSASLLNRLEELVSNCRHMNNFVLKCFKNRFTVFPGGFWWYYYNCILVSFQVQAKYWRQSDDLIRYYHETVLWYIVVVNYLE